MGPAAVRRPHRSWVPVTVLVAVAGIVAHLVWPSGPTGTVSKLSVSLAAAGMAVVGALRRPIEQRLPWLLVAAGLCLSALGDVLFEAITWRTGELPVVSWADGPWLLVYVVVGWGLVVLERRARNNRVDLDGLIDTAAVATVAALLVWELSLASTLADGSTPLLTRIVSSAYPVADVAVLALAFRLLTSRSGRAATGSVLAAAMGCWLLADIGFVLDPASAWTRWQDTAWMVGAVLMSAAVWRSLPADPDEAVARDESEARWPRVALSLAFLAVPALVDLAAYVRGQDTNPVPLVVAGLVLGGLVFVRAIRLLHARDAATCALVASEHRYRALAVHASDTVLVLDAHGRIGAEAPNLGVRAPSVMSAAGPGAAFVDLFGDDRTRAATLLERAMGAPGEVCEGELVVHEADGQDSWVAARLVNFLADADVGGVIVDLQDVTDRRRAELKLEHQAFHDALTGLGNRAMFLDRVEHAVARSARSGTDIAVIYLDLDGFKTVNDSLGHEAGDALLRIVAGRLTRSLRGSDTVARLGGDEFAVLLESDDAGERASVVADRILNDLLLPASVDGQLVAVSASLGIAVSDAEATASTLLRNADTAMYHAKATGRSRCARFEPSMGNAAVARLHVESDLAIALERGQLRVVFQPLIELEGGHVVGFEALLRWDHPELGVVAPDLFIPVAEETGMILPIGRWVLETACEACARWRADRPTGRQLTVSVNVSARQLLSPDFVDVVAAVLAATCIPPAALVVELTESVLVTDPEVVATQMHKLRHLGVRIAIDDFGTGYSSLSYLRQFPIDILKIDRSFIATITADGEVPALLRGLLELGRVLGLQLVAEGVERTDQRDAVRAQHCQLGQGFLFGRPIDAIEVEPLLGQQAPPVR